MKPLRNLNSLIFGVLLLLLSGSAAAAQTVLDDFEELTGWSTVTSEGAQAWILPDEGHTGRGMHVGFDLTAAGGYVIVRKEFSVPLPPNYAFTFYVRGDAPQNNFEFKLLDAGGKNVWWQRQHDFVFPTEWQQVTIRKSRIQFAWGPNGRDLKRVAAIELAISAGSGGKGSFWIDDLNFEERQVSGRDGVAPVVSTSSSIAGNEPALLLDGDPHTLWKSDPAPAEQWVLFDLINSHEYGGLTIDWDPDDYATAYRVQTSIDGEHWTTAYTNLSGHGRRDYVYMPDAESRYIRLALDASSRSQGYGIAEVALKPFQFSASPDQFFTAVAADAPPGSYPKYIYGKQSYWTVIGVNGDDKEGTLNEEGMLEVDKGAFSIEPFLYDDGRLVTWSTVRVAQSLEGGYLPIPSVTWQGDQLALQVTAFANGPPKTSALYATYRVENSTDAPRHVQLFLAIRPFQVNPPWQSLNMSGGVSPIREIKVVGRMVWVNHDKAVISLTAPEHVGAASFAQGAIVDFLREGRVPPNTEVSDPFGFASGALQYSFDLEAGKAREVHVAVPFHDAAGAAAARINPEDASSFVGSQLQQAREYWQRVLGRIEIDLPLDGDRIAKALKTTLAYILINRNGSAIQPGSRNYARSWIRDGALTSSALLQMGCIREVRDFIEWFARYQSADGKIPCCVDHRGADPVPENDSPGEFIWTVMEYYRFTHDVGFLQDMWPHVIKAVDYLSALRQKSMTGNRGLFYGLLPASISHEGYSAHPVHSYWDDFFALRGLKDAAAMALVLGDDERATNFAALRLAFQNDFYSSISKAMVKHKIDYIPGSADLGDFDPTSTTIALDPGGEAANLPSGALTRTFDQYFADFERRQITDGADAAYTPYELRNVGALVRLGRRDNALAVLKSMLADQRPQAWNAWAELTWRDAEIPRFIGDMPHTWVGSGFIRSIRSMLAYERESDNALVIAAGLPTAWVLDPAGVVVKRLPTHYGVLNYMLHREGSNALVLRLWGDLAMPPGKIVVQPPLPLKTVAVNGRPIYTFGPDSVTINDFPAEVILEY